MARRFGAMEAKTCLNIYMGINGKREENLLGLLPEDFDEIPRQKKIQDQVTYQYAANIYLFKINNRNIRKRCEICSVLTVKTTERRH